MVNRSGGFWPAWEDNKLFSVLLAIFLVYLIVFVFVKIGETMRATEQLGYADQMAPSINVSAEGTASAAPDIASIDLTVAEQAATSAAAQDASTTKSNAVLAKIQELGVAEADLKTSAYNVYPVYNYDTSPAIIVAYIASQAITVTVRDTALTDTVLAAAGDAGVTQIGDVRLEVDDETAVMAEARKKAIAKAYAQAVDIANAMGADLGRVVSYYESSGDMYAMHYERDLASTTPNIAEGMNEVTVNVSVTYAIE